MFRLGVCGPIGRADMHEPIRAWLVAGAKTYQPMSACPKTNAPTWLGGGSAAAGNSHKHLFATAWLSGVPDAFLAGTLVPGPPLPSF